jgi:2-oxo-4-hydroxy-4-carboxy--5-ureidoimidazoline (OHCU) decarboxylase
MNRMTIDEVNGLSHGEFVARLGWVFEHSPWVA